MAAATPAVSLAGDGDEEVGNEAPAGSDTKGLFNMARLDVFVTIRIDVPRVQLPPLEKWLL
jgi:hypothetical protein